VFPYIGIKPEMDRAEKAIYDHRELTMGEIVDCLADAGLLSSGTQEEEGDGSLRSEPSADGARVSFDELVDWVARLEVTVKPVDGSVCINAESMAEAIGDFLHLNGIEVTHG
jgi:hypothetical protein